MSSEEINTDLRFLFKKLEPGLVDFTIETNFHASLERLNFRIGTFNMVPTFAHYCTLQFVQQRGYRATQQITYSVIPKVPNIVGSGD